MTISVFIDSSNSEGVLDKMVARMTLVRGMRLCAFALIVVGQ
jgi:hypothetical protein